MMLRRAAWSLSLRTGTHFTRRLSSSSSSPATATATAEEKEKDGKSSGLFSSWVGKIKGAFESKASPSSAPPATLLDYADQLKKITRVANVASLVKLQRDVTQQTTIQNLEKCSTIFRALGKHNPTGENVNTRQKALAAEECGCTIFEVEKALAIFESLKKVGAKVKEMHEKGEQVPTTTEEIQTMLKSMFAERKLPQTQSTEVGRNDPCSCGSGKKFKRCCGRGS